MTLASRIKIGLLALAIAIGCTWGVGYLAYSAHADTGSDVVLLLDAGVGSAVGSGSAAYTAPEQSKHICTLDGKPIECEQLADHPAETMSEVTTLWKSGSFVPSIILALFALLTWASNHIEWLQHGKRAAYTATALTFLTLLVEPASRGTTPTLGMILSAAGGALLFFMNAMKKPKVAAPSS